MQGRITERWTKIEVDDALASGARFIGGVRAGKDVQPNFAKGAQF